MYKVTLWDNNCPSCTSGTFSIFVDDIYKFQKEWFELEKNEERKEQFNKSLGGELVTDYYKTDNDEKLNIVQEDKDARIIYRESFKYYRHAFNPMNAYGFRHIMIAGQSDFWFRGISYGGGYYVVGRYRLKGVCRIDTIIGGDRLMLTRENVYGNSILKTWYKSKEEFASGKPCYDTADFNNFKDDTIELIGYLPVAYASSKEELKGYMSIPFLQGLIESLIIDIPGEAG